MPATTIRYTILNHSCSCQYCENDILITFDDETLPKDKWDHFDKVCDYLTDFCKDPELYLDFEILTINKTTSKRNNKINQKIS